MNPRAGWVFGITSPTTRLSHSDYDLTGHKKELFLGFALFENSLAFLSALPLLFNSVLLSHMNPSPVWLMKGVNVSKPAQSVQISLFELRSIARDIFPSGHP